MKKSYHSTVVPTTVAKTTRRRSECVAIVPVGVKPSDCDDCVCEVLMRMAGSCAGWTSLSLRAESPWLEIVVARREVIIYDFKYDARARELMITENDTKAAADPRFAALPCRPGKIIAIHLSYASRADQRGRRPDAPSYFFKPSSSVAASGGSIERPAGTELLAFEGEIALVIGTPARRVALADAWDHVQWVTASNDLGLYDLRANDKGSNVRSKGGDGFTPIGPTLLDAAAIDPTALRLRTWVNSALAQDDTTAGLIFPLAQLVADLSQHFTLEPGDVILTGTPAGSSVIVPGDVVEVEVDAPDAEGAPSTGRLVTTVIEGDAAFDDTLGSLPTVDDQ